MTALNAATEARPACETVMEGKKVEGERGGRQGETESAAAGDAVVACVQCLPSTAAAAAAAPRLSMREVKVLSLGAGEHIRCFSHGEARK